MSDEIMLVFGEDSVAREYDDTWDITIHCESEEEQKLVWEKLKNSNQEAKTQLSREDTTLGVKKTCITCKHYPPESKWPCIDCDMRNPADRWEPQELSKNSPKLDKENGGLQPTCNKFATDTISRQDAIDALMDFDKKLRKINWYQYPHTEYECRGVDEAIVKIENVPSAQPEIIHCKECEYGVKDEYERWYCREFGCQVGKEDGSGFCADAERRTDG